MNTPADLSFSHKDAPGPDSTEAVPRSPNARPRGMIADPEQLLCELARMAELLRSPGDGSSQSVHTTPLTAVVRLVPGLDLPRWQSICSQCDGWFALPLGRTDEAAQDPVSGMLTASLFMERLTLEAEQALRSHHALSLALFELCDLDRLTDAAERAVRTLSSRLWESTARRDVPGCLQPGLLAMALPSAGQFQALAMAERIVHDAGETLQRQGQHCLVRAGIAAMEEEGGGAEICTATLLEHARQALNEASTTFESTLRDRVKLFRSNNEPDERETLVLASEKHFLFFGGA